MLSEYLELTLCLFEGKAQTNLMCTGKEQYLHVCKTLLMYFYYLLFTSTLLYYIILYYYYYYYDRVLIFPMLSIYWSLIYVFVNLLSLSFCSRELTHDSCYTYRLFFTDDECIRKMRYKKHEEQLPTPRGNFMVNIDCHVDQLARMLNLR